MAIHWDANSAMFVSKEAPRLNHDTMRLACARFVLPTSTVSFPVVIFDTLSRTLPPNRTADIPGKAQPLTPSSLALALDVAMTGSDLKSIADRLRLRRPMLDQRARLDRQIMLLGVPRRNSRDC